MKYKTHEMADKVYEIKAQNIVIYEEDYYDNIELLALGDSGASDFYRKFIVEEDGTFIVIDYEPLPPKEKSGDESFDVVVENEMKKEEKKVLDLRETYEELIQNYIFRHSSGLTEYAEDCKREAFEAYAEESLQDVIETVISNYYDSYTDFDEVTFNDEDIEQILIDNGILE